MHYIKSFYSQVNMNPLIHLTSLYLAWINDYEFQWKWSVHADMISIL